MLRLQLPLVALLLYPGVWVEITSGPKGAPSSLCCACSAGATQPAWDPRLPMLPMGRWLWWEGCRPPARPVSSVSFPLTHLHSVPILKPTDTQTSKKQWLRQRRRLSSGLWPPAMSDGATVSGHRGRAGTWGSWPRSARCWAWLPPAPAAPGVGRPVRPTLHEPGGSWPRGDVGSP